MVSWYAPVQREHTAVSAGWLDPRIGRDTAKGTRGKGAGMIFGLATRITMALVVILAAGVVMTTILSAHMFERTLSDFLTSRFEFELNDIRQRIQTQMDLGIELADLQSVPEELEEYASADEQILSIEVFDETGIVLFSTDPSFVGDLVTEEWVTAWRASRGREVWSDLERDARVVGAPLRDNLGRDVGSLALRYSRDFFDDNVTAQTARLLVIGTVVVLGMTPLSILGAMVLLRGLRGELRDLRESMDDVANRRRDGPVLGRTRADHPELAAFAAAALAAHDDIDTAIGEIRRLDEEEAV